MSTCKNKFQKNIKFCIRSSIFEIFLRKDKFLSEEKVLKILATPIVRNDPGKKKIEMECSKEMRSPLGIRYLMAAMMRWRTRARTAGVGRPSEERSAARNSELQLSSNPFGTNWMSTVCNHSNSRNTCSHMIRHATLWGVIGVIGEMESEQSLPMQTQWECRSSWSEFEGHRKFRGSIPMIQRATQNTLQTFQDLYRVVLPFLYFAHYARLEQALQVRRMIHLDWEQILESWKFTGNN